MDINKLKILLVEDNLADADWIGEILTAETWQQLDLKHVKRVREALDSLSQDDFDAILLDLSLPDSQGIDSLDLVKQQAPQLPIVVLTALNDRNIAIESVRQGAQDYLVKGRFEGELLSRSIYYAIERQRTEVNLRQQALMKKMLDKIRNSLNLSQILQTTVAEIKQFLKTDRVLIYCCESGQSEETTVCSVDLGQNTQPKIEFTAAVNLSSLRSILSESTSVRMVEDTLCAPQEDIYVVTGNSIRSFLILPIWRSQAVAYVYEEPDLPLVKQTTTYNKDEGLWGMLVAYNFQQTRKWQDWEINFLQRLTTQVTIAIQQSEVCCQLQVVNKKLQQLAILDGLTGIANRRYFDLVLNNEWQRLARERQPLSLILCDIDYFKAYNDAYGHPQGDRCLQKVAKILRTSIRRPADLVARYGGEEFAVILPNTDFNGAFFVATQIKERLAQKQIAHCNSKISNYITCSIGIITQVPQSTQTAKIAVALADRALYRAKKQGRDCIVGDRT
ncbi:MAG: diguanylate cyclase domain-containing protein [Pleurocapsa sp.]